MKKKIYIKTAFTLILSIFLTTAISCKKSHSGPLFPFRDGSDSYSNYGAIDSSGNIIIEPQYIYLREYSEGLMFAKLLKRKYRNMSSREIAAEQNAHYLPDEAFLDKSGFIDTKGKFIIHKDILQEFGVSNTGWIFSDGLCYKSQNGYVGYIDKSGEFAIQPKYGSGKNFSDGVAFASIKVVTTESSRPKFIYGVIDKKGEWIIKPQFCSHGFNGVFSKFENGLAAISQNERPYGHVYKSDLKTYTNIVDGKKYTIKPMQGFIDKTGKLVTSIDKKYYIYANTYNEGLIVFQHSNRITGEPYSYYKYPFGYMDTKGKIVIDMIPGTQAMNEFDILEAKFSEGLAAIKIGGVWGYINREGEFVIKPQFRYAHPFRHGLAWVGIQGKKGDCYIDKEGNVIFPKEPKN